MIVKGYACHFNKRNANGEIVLPTSFDEGLKRFQDNNLSIPINYNHESGMILGKVTDIVKDETGLYIEAELNDNVALVRDMVAPLIKDGTLDRFSTEGYVRYDDIEEVGDRTYIAKNFEITAVAIVPLPADIEAVFTYNSQKKNGKYKVALNAFESGVKTKKHNNKGYFVI